jgi:hypothetical protein
VLGLDRVRILDRMLRMVLPVALGGGDPPRQLADGLWVVARDLRFPPALRMPNHMTLMRRRDGRLLVHAPVRLEHELLFAVRGLGDVAAIIAPNTFHYRFVAEWVREFPQAELFAAPGLAQRVPSLPASVPLSDTPPAAWAGEVEQIVFGPVGPFSEVAFLHLATRTLLLSDLAFHMVRFESPIQKVCWRLMGVPEGFGPSRTARLTLLRDRQAARPYLQRIAAWDFDRIIVAHGEVIESGGSARFHSAFAGYL